MPIEMDLMKILDCLKLIVYFLLLKMSAAFISLYDFDTEGIFHECLDVFKKGEIPYDNMKANQIEKQICELLCATFRTVSF